MKLFARYAVFFAIFLLVVLIVILTIPYEVQSYILSSVQRPASKTGVLRSHVQTSEHWTTPSCHPKSNIVFIKTQRCASSTLQNILYRWGDQRNLSFVLPKGKWPYMGNPSLFDKRFAIESADGVYNILANHARFSDKGISEIMPGNSIFISILRNPVAQYESMYQYDSMKLRFGVDMRSFLNRPLLYFQKEPPNTHIAGRNSMMYDLGLDARTFEVDNQNVSDWIEMLDRKFHLVLITEYLPESLILLKDILCWSMDDILHLKHNARKARNRTHHENVHNNIRQWNSVDVRLYDHFNRTLWRKIESYGVERMRRDVELLGMKNELMTADCVKGIMREGDDRIWYPPGVNIESFQVNPNASNPDLCNRVTRPENVYLELLQRRQRRRNAVIRGVPLTDVTDMPKSKVVKTRIIRNHKVRRAKIVTKSPRQ